MSTPAESETREAKEIEPELTIVLNGFRRILQTLRRAAGETQSRYQVSAAQLFVLDELYDAGTPLSIKELAELTMTDRSSVADVVDRLIAGGHATRNWSADDRRRAEVRLTATGEKLARSAPPAPAMRLISALREIPQSDLRALARGMTRLLRQLGISEEKAGLMFEDGSANGLGPVRPASGASPAEKRSGSAKSAGEDWAADYNEQPGQLNGQPDTRREKAP